MGVKAEEIVNSIMDTVDQQCKDINDQDLYQVLNMVSYRCQSKIDEIERPVDEQLLYHQEQLLGPYHK